MIKQNYRYFKTNLAKTLVYLDLGRSYQINISNYENTIWLQNKWEASSTTTQTYLLILSSPTSKIKYSVESGILFKKNNKLKTSIFF